MGVSGEPETFSKRISQQDEILVLASDGVFEFLQNQAIMDICSEKNDPLIACDALVDTAYKRWLEFEDRTDDITAIVMFLRRHPSPKE